MSAENLNPMSWEHSRNPSTPEQQQRRGGKIMRFLERLRGVGRGPQQKSMEYRRVPSREIDSPTVELPTVRVPAEAVAAANQRAHAETQPVPHAGLPEQKLEAVPPVIGSEFAQSLNGQSEGGRHRPESDEHKQNYSVDAITNRINAEKAEAELQNPNVIGSDAWHAEQLNRQHMQDFEMHVRQQGLDHPVEGPEVIGSAAWHAAHDAAENAHQQGLATVHEIGSIPQKEYPSAPGDLFDRQPGTASSEDQRPTQHAA